MITMGMMEMRLPAISTLYSVPYWPEVRELSATVSVIEFLPVSITRGQR